MIFLPLRFGQSRATVSSVGATNPEVEAAVEEDVVMAYVVDVVGVIEGVPEEVVKVGIGVISIVDVPVLGLGHNIGAGARVDNGDLIGNQT